MARHRALNRHDLMRATLIIGLLPVFIIGMFLAALMWIGAPWLADLFSDPKQADNVTQIIRSMAPFLPLAAVYNVVVQGTRGFDTMLPQMVIEKVTRALALPVIAYVAAVAGVGTAGFGALWAATNVIALVPAMWIFSRLINNAVDRAGSEHAAPDAVLFREFWKFTAPRAVGQVSEVVVNWLDTVLVGGLVSARAAGIYGSGTRYLLPGQFTADALMQVSGSRVSGLLAVHKNRDAEVLLKVTTAWQSMITWPLYLIVACFSVPLLRVFGPEVVEAQVAVIALSMSMLVISLFGPVQSVILMSGRSRQAMLNTFVVVAINLGGNLLLVPTYGLNAAGIVWAVTIVVAVLLPAWQTHRHLGIVTVNASAIRVAAAALVTVGLASGLSLLVFGGTALGLLAGGVLGGIPYTLAVWRMREELELPVLFQGFARRSRQSATPTPDPAP
jgi:O-antigen/teichoic acid export membrane protein